jgi:hypothetical protein
MSEHDSCLEFRGRLEDALRGGASALGALAWSGHVVDCVACRELLAAEEALEALLASLPRPALPPDLAARVLARLAEARRLDELLERGGAAPAPAGLAERVLAGLSAEGARRGDALDRLLGRLPEPAVPSGLAERVIASAAAAAGPTRTGARPSVTAWRARVAWLAAAAAVVAAGTLAWRLLVDGGGGGAAPSPERGPAPIHVAHVTPEDTVDPDDPPAALLAALPVLENWDLLMEADLDVLLAGLDAAAALQLELGAPAAEATEPAPPAGTAPAAERRQPSRG